jgi:hypothetical protein
VKNYSNELLANDNTTTPFPSVFPLRIFESATPVEKEEEGESEGAGGLIPVLTKPRSTQERWRSSTTPVVTLTSSLERAAFFSHRSTSPYPLCTSSPELIVKASPALDLKVVPVLRIATEEPDHVGPSTLEERQFIVIG